MELPGVLSNTLLDKEDEKWFYQPIKNLDHFFSSFYYYYINKGLHNIILSHICDLLTLGFTLIFSIFLLFFIKWDQLNDCKDESTCNNNLSSYIESSPFHYHSIITSFFMVIYIMLSIVFWIWQLLNSLQRITEAIEMDIFYREKLNLTIESLQYLQWNEVVESIINLHKSGKYRVVATDKLTEETIILRIMRKENYLIALINKKLLDIRVPWWMRSFLSENLFLTKSLEWSLSFCILDYIFTDQFAISSDFLHKPGLLRRRFLLTGVINFLLLPFILIFMIIHFFLSNTQLFHINRSYLGPREWSPLALWTFRDFNELPHIFDNRIKESYQYANTYVGLVYNSYFVILGQFLCYISGSFIAVLLLISLFSESVLLFVHLSDHNLLWYLGIFTAVYAASRSVIPDTSVKSNQLTADELLVQISTYTHYLPDNWINKGNSTKVRNEFKQLFQFKIQIFAMEVLSVILTPVVLCFSLPHCTEAVLEFVRHHSKYVEGVGAVCDYSLMDVAKHGQERFGAPNDGLALEIERPNDGKLEQSYFNFRQAYPNWEGNETGRLMEENLNYYKFAKEYDRENQFNNYLQNSLMKKSTRFNNSAIVQSEAYSTNSPSSNENTNYISVPTETVFSTIRNTIAKPRPIYTAISKTDDLDDENNYQENPLIIKDDNKGKTIPGNWGKSISANDTNARSSDYEDRLSSTDINNKDINSNINADNSSGNVKSTNIYQNSNYFLPNKREFKHTIKQLLDNDDIDYNNTSYWLSRYRKDKLTDPLGLERSFNQSKLILSGLNSTNPNIFDFSQFNSQLISGSLFNSTSMMSSPNEKSVGFTTPARTSPTYVNHTPPINNTIHSRKKEINKDMTESV